MAKTEMISIKRMMPVDELDQHIKSIEKDVKILKRLYYVKYRYSGETVEIASRKVGVTKMIGYEWQSRWNKDGYNGLIPRYAGGRPSKLSDDQKVELKGLLKDRNDWTTSEVRELIKDLFHVEYTLKQIRIILKKFGMKFGKPFVNDYRRPANAEDILKKP